MNAANFLGTSILLYAYDQDAPAKRTVALRLVEEGWKALGQTAISVQVLQEMHVNLVKRGVSRSKCPQQFSPIRFRRGHHAWQFAKSQPRHQSRSRKRLFLLFWHLPPFIRCQPTARPITSDGNPCRTALNQEANRFRVRFSSRLCIIV